MCSDLLDDLYLSIEARRTTLNQGNIGSQAHLVDMPPRVQVVQGVEDNVEALKPVDVELGVFYVGVVSFELDIRVELSGGVLGDLERRLVSRGVLNR